jgi:hypothetical protein
VNLSGGLCLPENYRCESFVIARCFFSELIHRNLSLVVVWSELGNESGNEPLHPTNVILRNNRISLQLHAKLLSDFSEDYFFRLEI